MKHKVDGWNNFCRVFMLPKSFSSAFCSSGGIPTNFQMVDWFYPVQDLPQPTISKEVWRKKVGEIEIKQIDLDELSTILVPFLLKKIYIKQGREYLVLFDFGASLVFKAAEKPDLSKCPNCGGPADNGHDRCVPPNVYCCTKCTKSEED